jgi:hypothetical protein
VHVADYLKVPHAARHDVKQNAQYIATLVKNVAEVIFPKPFQYVHTDRPQLQAKPLQTPTKAMFSSISNLPLLARFNLFLKVESGQCDIETVEEWLQTLAEKAEVIKSGTRLETDSAKEVFLCAEPKVVNGKAQYNSRSR